MALYTCLCAHEAFTSHLTSAGCIGNTVFSFLVRESAGISVELRGPQQDGVSVLEGRELGEPRAESQGPRELRDTLKVYVVIGCLPISTAL